MSKLTGEELSNLYPQAKTYDQLHAEHEAMEEARRPKFVALKIATCTTLVALAALGTYQIALRLLPSFESGDMGNVMLGVCGAILSAIAGLVVIRYLYSLIDDVASKVFLNTAPLYFVLVMILCASGSIGALFFQEHGIVSMALATCASTFGLSLLAVALSQKFNS